LAVCRQAAVDVWRERNPEEAAAFERRKKTVEQIFKNALGEA
jgi:hypothetical protein